MILFYEDWKNGKHPYAMVHMNTRNRSWVELALKYKQMGIRNHSFLLALHNPMLEFVDPYDPDLSMRMIGAIAKECKDNPWYFFREILRVTASGSVNGAPVKANRLNISIWWLYFNHITSFNIIGRQMGKSTTMFGLDTYLLGIGTKSTDLHLFTKDNNLRVKSIAQIKEMLESLPPYLRMKNRKDTYNTEKITISRLNNVYHTSVAQPSAKSAEGVGRGFTVSNHRVDEFNFIANVDISLPVLLSSSTAAVDSAKANGGYYGNIFASTAGTLSTKEGRYGYKLYNSCFRWSELLFDSENQEELVSFIKKNSPSGEAMVLCEFNHIQLGYTNDWMREKMAAAMAFDERGECEFLNKWLDSNESCPISPEHIAIMKENIIEDYTTTMTSYGYIIKWYVPTTEVSNRLINRKLVVGLDTSDAVGNDDIAMCIRDVTTGEVVGTGIYNETNLITFANWLVDFMIEYPTTILIIERKSSGVMIIDNLLLLLPTKGIDPFKRLFNWVTNGYTDKKEYKEVVNTPLQSRSSAIYTKYRNEFGYATSAAGRSSRDNLYGTAFTSSIKYTCSTVRDKDLFHQLTGLIRRNERIDHGVGGHDDMCFTGDMLIRTINGNIPIRDLKLGDLVLTREGYKPVIAIYKREAEVITKYGITGTPEHPFITPSGIIEFKDIKDNTEVYVWKDNKLTTILAKDIEVINNNVYKDKELVYNLTVADCHEYFVNNVLVHNCIAWLLGYWFLISGKNLQLYGLSPRSVLVSVSTAMIAEEGGQEAIEKQKEQTKLIQQIEELASKLKNTTDLYQYELIFNKIKFLSQNIDEAILSKKFNMESLLDDIRRNKTKQYSNKLDFKMGL